MASARFDITRIAILCDMSVSKPHKLSQFGVGKYSVNQATVRANIIGPIGRSFHLAYGSLLCSGPISMFIPLKDINPSRTYPFVNITLIAANVAVFFYQLSLQFTMAPRAYAAFLSSYGTVPARFPSFFGGHGTFEMTFLPILTSMFLHSGFLHIAGNMLFLWIFGDNVEDFFGHIPYLFFYIFCGIGAGLVHVFFNLYSHVPALGASGAISGVMGAYILLFPRARILTLVFVFLLPIPAVFVLGEWFLGQFLLGINALGGGSSGGVAVMAHVGGFLLGMLITAIVRWR